VQLGCRLISSQVRRVEHEALVVIARRHNHFLARLILELLDVIDRRHVALDGLDDLAATRVDHAHVSHCRGRYEAIGEEGRPEKFREAAELAHRHRQSLSEVRQVVYVDLTVDTCRAGHRLRSRDSN